MPARRPTSVLFVLLAIVLMGAAVMRATGWTTRGNATVLADLAFLSFFVSFLPLWP